MTSITRLDYESLMRARVFEPHKLTQSLHNRARRELVGPDGNLMLIAADHPARGALSVGNDPLALADRFALLANLITALDVSGVDGVMASADILEELAFFGALENKLAFGTINRGGLSGTLWGLDDRLTAYDTRHVSESGLDGSKLLLRIEPSDVGVVRTLEMAARIVSEMADHKLMCMVEPLPYLKDASGMPYQDNSVDALIRCAAIASGLGASSAYTWLKLPGVSDMKAVAAATSMPIIMLGGDPGEKTTEVFSLWESAMEIPNVRGLIAGRSMLFPHDGDISRAVQQGVQMVHATDESP